MHACHCSASAILSYKQRLSGPLLDRIDMTIEVARLPVEKLVREDGGAALSGRQDGGQGRPPHQESGGAETSAMIKVRVMSARALQSQRQGAVTNASLSSKQVKRHCALDEAGLALLTRAVERLGLSARAYERIRKVARTIADLDQSEHIQVPHLAEAIQYRSGEERLRG